MAGRGGRRRLPASARRRAQARRRNQGSDLGARVLAALPAIAFAIFIVAEGGSVFAVGLAALGIICLHELYAMFDSARPIRLAGFIGLIGLIAAARFGDQYQVVLVLVALLPVLFGLTVAQAGGRGTAIAMAMTLFGIYWIGLAFAHTVLLRGLPHGDGLVIDVLVGTFIGDTAAYLGGRAFGSRPLAPTISPGKTLEGLGFGMFAAIVAVWLASGYQTWLSGTDALLLGLGVAVAAPLGDLFESFVKRDAGTKDAGSIFGPHGGALDRLDAAMFSLVVSYYIAVAIF